MLFDWRCVYRLMDFVRCGISLKGAPSVLRSVFMTRF